MTRFQASRMASASTSPRRPAMPICTMSCSKRTGRPRACSGPPVGSIAWSARTNAARSAQPGPDRRAGRESPARRAAIARRSTGKETTLRVFLRRRVAARRAGVGERGPEATSAPWLRTRRSNRCAGVVRPSLHRRGTWHCRCRPTGPVRSGGRPTAEIVKRACCARGRRRCPPHRRASSAASRLCIIAGRSRWHCRVPPTAARASAARRRRGPAPAHGGRRRAPPRFDRGGGAARPASSAGSGSRRGRADRRCGGPPRDHPPRRPRRPGSARRPASR